MVSTKGQLDLCYVPFKSLINQETLLTETRLIDAKSDFHRLATDLGTRIVHHKT
jgi:hypothetical protein